MVATGPDHRPGSEPGPAHCLDRLELDPIDGEQPLFVRFDVGPAVETGHERAQRPGRRP
jgi:hypothetical protein